MLAEMPTQLPTGGFSKVMLRSFSLLAETLLRLVMWEEVRPASVGRECLAAFHTYMWVYLHVPCAPSQDRLPRRAVVQCRHV